MAFPFCILSDSYTLSILQSQIDLFSDELDLAIARNKEVILMREFNIDAQHLQQNLDNLQYGKKN
jgi:hypothetical protein